MHIRVSFLYTIQKSGLSILHKMVTVHTVFLYTGVIMPRIPVPPEIRVGKNTKYKIQYEFHVNIKHKLQTVLYLKIQYNLNHVQTSNNIFGLYKHKQA